MVIALSVLTRLFAPFLPFVTDETWSWWHAGSVHRAAWPTEAEILETMGQRDTDASAIYLVATVVLGEIRKQKTLLQLSAGTAVTAIKIFNDDDLAVRLEGVTPDLKAAARADTLSFEADTAFRVDIAGAQERAK
jgi:valyl-tRNA synthetase